MGSGSTGSELEVALRALNRADPQSWASEVQRNLAACVSRDASLTVSIHELRCEPHQMSSRLSEDTQFLRNVRELIRFVKEA